jgi:hypothetical protein
MRLHNNLNRNLGVISEEFTLGEESFLDKKFANRNETAYAESDSATLLEISPEGFVNLKEIMIESGLKRDFMFID